MPDLARYACQNLLRNHERRVVVGQRIVSDNVVGNSGLTSSTLAHNHYASVPDYLA